MARFVKVCMDHVLGPDGVCIAIPNHESYLRPMALNKVVVVFLLGDIFPSLICNLAGSCLLPKQNQLM